MTEEVYKMALIICPECGKEISDKAISCPHCGCPASEFYCEESKEKVLCEFESCPYCGEELFLDDGYCSKCGMRIVPLKRKDNVVNSQSEVNTTFNGVYKVSLFGEKQEVHCPRCGSENCAHYKEQRVIPGKTKTSYSANLNPFKPFTFINKKEKVVRKDRIVIDDKFICNSCGKIFR